MSTQQVIQPRQALQQIFGFDTFRGPQEQIVQHVLSRNNAFVIMPTGAGKSLCYQLPATMMPGTAIVISPLIALMKNQVDQMVANGVAACYLNSTLSKAKYDDNKQAAREGRMKLLYVAPESLVKPSFMKFLRSIEISFVAVDEAHCISEWGHDFRPEYRRIRQIINEIDPAIPLIALTATATPKVQHDIQKNLGIEDAGVFKTSFNRENLYYEIRPKVNPTDEIVKYIKQHPGESGIVYCLSRKRVEELANLLTLNGISAVPYHAGLDADTRARHQDMFLGEQVQVVVATIAFGMGIDKPDVRFVIHQDVPKSIESYYQETGRAGRDGQEGNCILFYSYNDILKLEKFMKDKPVSEREAGKHLLHEMAAFSESGLCRRQHLLHYFGEEYDTSRCTNLCDNCRKPKPTFDAKDDALLAIKAVSETGGHFDMAYLVNLLEGANPHQIHDTHMDHVSVIGKGKHRDRRFWQGVFTQLIVLDYLQKDIEDYGNIKLGKHAADFLAAPSSVQLYEPTDHTTAALTKKATVNGNGNGHHSNGNGQEHAYDPVLYDALMALRDKVAKQKKLQPYLIFLDSSIEEMALKFPTSKDEFEHLTGVGKGKLMKYGEKFLKLIREYVEDNDIQHDEDVIVKHVANNNMDKLFIIQQIDRRTPLDEIADMKGISLDTVIERIEQIIYSGSKLNIGYYVDSVIDQDVREGIYDYFMETPTDCLKAAEKELGDEYTREEIQLVRAQFYSEVAN